MSRPLSVTTARPEGLCRRYEGMRSDLRADMATISEETEPGELPGLGGFPAAAADTGGYAKQRVQLGF